MAGTTGLEPATSAVTGQRSNQLSYVPKIALQQLGYMSHRAGEHSITVRFCSSISLFWTHVWSTQDPANPTTTPFKFSRTLPKGVDLCSSQSISLSSRQLRGASMRRAHKHHGIVIGIYELPIVHEWKNMCDRRSALQQTEIHPILTEKRVRVALQRRPSREFLKHP